MIPINEVVRLMSIAEKLGRSGEEKREFVISTLGTAPFNLDPVMSREMIEAVLWLAKNRSELSIFIKKSYLSCIK